MVIEDDPRLLSMVGYVLRWYGYRVFEAANPLDAQALTRNLSDSVDLIVMDIYLPGANGYDVAQSLLQAKPIRGALFMSGIAQNHAHNTQSLSAKSEFLMKPFSPDALIGKVRALLGTEGASRSQTET